MNSRRRRVQQRNKMVGKTHGRATARNAGLERLEDRAAPSDMLVMLPLGLAALDQLSEPQASAAQSLRPTTTAVSRESRGPRHTAGRHIDLLQILAPGEPLRARRTSGQLGHGHQANPLDAHRLVTGTVGISDPFANEGDGPQANAALPAAPQSGGGLHGQRSVDLSYTPVLVSGTFSAGAAMSAASGPTSIVAPNVGHDAIAPGSAAALVQRAEGDEPADTPSGEVAQPANAPPPDSTPAPADSPLVVSVVETVPITPGLDGWEIGEHGGTAAGRGSVVGDATGAVLREGNSLLVTLAHSFTATDESQQLRFTYEDLTFDTSERARINDAFEFAVVDSVGRPLVFPFATGRDASWNVTEELASISGRQVTEHDNTVTVDLSEVPAGTEARVVFRLVNNDGDIGTSVRITRMELVGVRTDTTPTASIHLLHDTAPEGPDGEPYQTDGLTNDPVVTGEVYDLEGIQSVEIDIDGVSTVDITPEVENGAFTFDPGPLANGQHRLAVRVRDTSGQVTTDFVDFRVNAPPLANAGGNRTITEGSTVMFDGGGSTDAEAPIFQHTWLLDDGTIVDGALAAKEYRQDGTYSVTLKVMDTAGSVATDAVQVAVVNLPATISALEDRRINEGDNVTLLAAFTDPGVLDTHAAVVDWGDGNIEPIPVVVETGESRVERSHRYVDDGVFLVTLSVTDDGGAGSEESFTVVVDNVAPRVTLAEEWAANEGEVVDMVGTFTDAGALDTHTATFHWSDGSSTPGIVNEAGGLGAVTAQHVYADNGAYLVRLEVRDNGGSSGSSESIATIENVTPHVTPATNQAVGEGIPISLTVATCSDPGFTNAVAGTQEWFAATINWGDGFVEPGTLSVTTGEPELPSTGAVAGEHTYANDGFFTVTVEVADDDGGTDTSSFIIAVLNQPPSLALVNDLSGREGEEVVLVASFTDMSWLDTHTARVWWGDGTTSIATIDEAAGVGTLRAPHVYADNGHYPVRIEVQDDGGAAIEGLAEAVITNQAPAVTAAANHRTTEGTLLSLEIATFTDAGFTSGLAGTVETFSATIDWGDGTNGPGLVTTVDGGIGVATLGVVHGEHRYANDGDYAVTVTVRDDDQGAGVASLQLRVDNAAPAVAPVGTLHANEGAVVQLSTMLTDPGLLDTHSAAVDWGDGTHSPAMVIAGLYGSTITASHTYADNGIYPIHLNVTDNAGGTTVGDAQAIIENVAPTVSAVVYMPAGGSVANVGDVVTVVGSFTDPGFDNAAAGTVEAFTAKIDWGDGSPVALASIAWVSGSIVVHTRGEVNSSHTYNSAGTFLGELTVEDDDGGIGVTSFVVQVAQLTVGSCGYVVPGEPGELMEVTFNWVVRDATYKNELGFYPLDAASGEVNGLAPGEADYARTALTRDEQRIVFTNSDTVGAVARMIVPAGTPWSPYLVQNSTRDLFLAQNAANSLNVTPQTWFCFAAANPDGVDHFQRTNLADGVVQFAVEDLTGGGDLDFNDIVFTITAVPATASSHAKFVTVDSGADAAFRYGTTGAVGSASGLATPNSSPRGVTMTAAGDRYWVIDGSKKVYVYHADGSLQGAWRPKELKRPVGIATDGNDLWILDGDARRIKRYAGGAARTFGAPSPTSQFSLHSYNTTPTDMATDGSRFWVTDDAQDQVFVYSLGGKYLGRWKLDARNADPAGITHEPGAGTNLWVVDRVDDRVYQYAGGEGWLTGSRSAGYTFALAGGNQNPEGIADPPTSGDMSITPQPGYEIAWDGSNGDYYSPSNPAMVPDNAALATHGITSFGSSQYGGVIHLIANINDGKYGNSNSWLANFAVGDPDPYIGLKFNQTLNLTSIAWGRDNGNTVTDACGGTCSDRSIGTYTLQITNVSDPGTGTAETGDAATGWKTVGMFTYNSSSTAFTPHLRHLYTLAEAGNPIAATGLRMKVSDDDIVIDEIELNALPSTSDNGTLIADSVTEFSGTQGQDSWLYGYWNVTADPNGYQSTDFVQFPPGAPSGSEAPRFGFNGVWEFLGPNGPINPPWTELTRLGGTPNGANESETHWAIRRWVSEADGTVQISGQINAGNECGDGIVGRIYIDGTQAFAFPHFANFAAAYSLQVPVEIGSVVDFIIDSSPGNGNVSPGNDLCDGSTFTALINESASQTGGGDTLLGTRGRVAFTTTEEFNQGTWFNVNATDVPDELRLNTASETDFLPFIWIANSGEGTVSKFDTRTGKELGRYRTGNLAPSLLSPSRTAVTADGDVWVANRSLTRAGVWDQASMVKVLNQDFIDRNGDGVVQTSYDQNGNGRIDTNEILPWDADGDGQPDDERIAAFVNVGRSRTSPYSLLTNGNDNAIADDDNMGSIARSITFDQQGRVWVGLYNYRQYEVYDNNGNILNVVPVTDGSPYGGVVDRNGQLWGATAFSNLLQHIDTNTMQPMASVNFGRTTYGITIDSDGVLWVSNYDFGSVSRWDPQLGGTPSIYPIIGGVPQLRGVTIDPDRNIWVASSARDSLFKLTFEADHRTLRLQPEGIREVTGIGDAPSAAVIDGDGYVWTTRINDNQASKIDRTTRAVVGTVKTGLGPYNYSDLTGRLLPVRTGRWSEIIDSEREGTVWAGIELDSDTPLETTVEIRVRVAEQREALAAQPFQLVTANEVLSNLRGRYLEVQSSLASRHEDANPAVRELAVIVAGPPSITLDPVPPELPTELGSLVISGTALADWPADATKNFRNRILQVTVNGRPVDVLDDSGSFFTKVDVLPGENVFTFTGIDATGQTVTATLSITGTQNPPSQIDLSLFTDVTGSLQSEYGRTSFTEATEVLYADLAIRNVGQYPVDMPLLVGVTNISDPTVRVRDADGITPGGIPYYDFTALVADGTLSPGELTDSRALAFFDPQRVPFQYDLVILGMLNRAPSFATIPESKAIIGRNYSYDADATDADGNPLSFSLASGPAGMEVNTDTGVLTWDPQTADRGTHSIAIRVADGRGGTAEQRYTLSVLDTPPNSPPRFTSVPVVGVREGELYTYRATADDADADAIAYSLTTAPDGMTVDPVSGQIDWTPAGNQVGTHAVALAVNDGRGGVATQAFVVNVETDEVVAPATNFPPVITSHPSGPATTGQPWRYEARAQDANGDTLIYRLDIAPNGMAIDAATGVVSWTPAINQVGNPNVVLAVTDGHGGEARQTFNLLVVATASNSPPQIISTPRQITRQGTAYLYVVSAVDLNGDPLSFALAQGPVGMTIDAFGLVSWTPTASQLGSHDVEVTVADGRGGTATQPFTLLVTAQVTNAPPTILSNPPGAAVVGQLLAYDAVASDPNGDFLLWDLPVAPRGMSIDVSLGTIRWTPATDQAGAHEITVRAQDSFGAYATQTWTLTVHVANLPPAIASVPPTDAVVNRAYLYAINAFDTEIDPLSISLTTAPAGMVFDAAIGAVRWTPTAAQLGNHLVTVRVSDNQGGYATQSYHIFVSAAANAAPAITSSPAFTATVDQPYLYDVEATDPDGNLLTFGLFSGPVGMSIDAASGVVAWTPTAAQLGTHEVIVYSLDSQGAVGGQRFTLTVRDVNRTPNISSSPVQTVTAGASYRYDVRATDPDGDPLTYRLDAASAARGLLIDGVGRITWLPRTADIGTQSVEVTVTDDRGATQFQTYELTVLADAAAPRVNLFVSQNPTLVGSLITLAVSATDNVGVVNVGLTRNGVSVPLDAQGRVTLRAEPAGFYDLVASATDLAGNTAFSSSELQVIVADSEWPSVEIISPAEGATITSPVDVIGTVNDINLISYVLEAIPASGGLPREIFRGTTPVISGVLGKFDPTGLANDTYRLRLTATDAGANVSSIETTVNVAGDLKVGNFTLSFTDLTIPVSGIPITVSRTYDTLLANQADELGYGWRLEIKDVDLRTSVGLTGGEQDGFFNPFYDGAKVYVTTPGGRREGFTFQPIYKGFCVLSQCLDIFEPQFAPDPGVTSQLTVDRFTLLRQADGTYTSFSSGELPYNPASTSFSGRYTLTTKDGIRYEIDGLSGDARSIADTNNNSLTFTSDGVVSSTGQRVTLERDPQGRVAAVVDPAGNRVRYQYDARGDLVSVTDRSGNATTFVYDTARPHYLVEVKDPLGRSGVRSEYDAQGRLVTLRDADGNPVQLVHDPDNFVETVIDAMGHPTTFEYDARGNVVRETDALGGVTERTYDSANNTLTETIFDGVHPEGATTTFAYDPGGNVTSETDPFGKTTFYTYNALSQPLTITDPLGNTTTSIYDSRGNLLATADALGKATTFTYDLAGNATSITDAGGDSTRFEYDARGNLIRQTDALDHITTFTYDANGNQLTQMTTVTGPAGPLTVTTTTEYDASGRSVKTTDAEGGIMRTEYSALGKQRATIDALGRRTEYFYDERGLLIETQFADGTATTTTYDELGRGIAATDRGGRTTNFEYDAAGRLIATILPDGTPENLTDNPRTRTEYDLAGKVSAQIDELGHRTEFEYDLAGRQSLVRDALLHETTTTYDAAGRVVSVTDALGNTTGFVLDALGRQTETIFADATRTRREFDDVGHVVAQMDQAGHTTRYEYDALGRLTAVVDALMQRTEYGYNESGNLVFQQDALGTSTADPAGRITRYEYDRLGRRTATILPLGQRSETEYDALGNIVATTDFNGQTISYDYDPNNQLLAKHFPGGASVVFTYADTGQRESYTDDRGTTTWTYDERDRLLSRTEPDGQAITYAYDAAGNRTNASTTAGTIVYTFDDLNRTETVTDPDGGVTRYEYDASGRLVRTDLPNGTWETRQHDDVGHLLILENRGPAGLINRFAYTLDPTGNRTAVEEADRRVDYAYDAIYRLIGEAITDPVAGNRAIDYTYDPVGNRLTRSDSAEGTTTYAYDDNDRLIDEVLAGDTTRYTYDNNGNTLSKVTGAADQAFYHWDAENRLVAADVTDAAGTKHIEYQYDADGIRVSSNVDVVETRYLIDTSHPFQQVALEYTPGGIVLVSYVHGNDLISQNRRAEDGMFHRSFFHVDGLGSTRALSDALGLVSDRYVYDAFGRTIGQFGATGNVYLFAGEQRDANIGMDYLRARYLDVSRGRFVSRDSFAGFRSSPITLNSFLYAHSAPVNLTDPSGHFSLIEVSVTFSSLTDIQANFARAGLNGITRVARVIEKLLQPANSIREVGLAMVLAGKPGGSELYQLGMRLTSLGFRAINVSLLGIYGETIENSLPVVKYSLAKKLEKHFKPLSIEFKGLSVTLSIGEKSESFDPPSVDDLLNEYIAKIESQLTENNLQQFLGPDKGPVETITSEIMNLGNKIITMLQ